jgi:hypothetical protein
MHYYLEDKGNKNFFTSVVDPKLFTMDPNRPFKEFQILIRILLEFQLDSDFIPDPSRSGVRNIREEGRIGKSDYVVVQCELQMNMHHHTRVRMKNWKLAEHKRWNQKHSVANITG